MGLFDKFKAYQENKQEKRIEKAGKLVKNAKAIKDDRWAAIHYLSKNAEGVERVLEALLPRFQYSLEHGIQDSREKELVLEGIVRFGEEAIPVLESWIQQTDRIAWPIKALNQVGSEEQVFNVLMAALEFDDVRFDQAKVDKNYDILCYIRDYQFAGSEDKIAHFLKDSDERVRFAAAEALIDQESDDVSKYLEPFLKDGSSENRRLQEATMRAFIKRAWKLSDPKSFEETFASSAVKINGQGQLVAPA